MKLYLFALIGIFQIVYCSIGFSYPSQLLPNSYGFNSEQFPTTQSYSSYDSETVSDELTYSPLPCSIQYYLNASGNSQFCGTVGSLSKKSFLVDIQLVMAKTLPSNTVFRFTVARAQDFSRSEESQWVEVLFPTFKNLSIGLAGNFHSQKALDDLNLSFNFAHNKGQGRLEFTANEYSLSEKSYINEEVNTAPVTTTYTHLLRPSKKILYYLQISHSNRIQWTRPLESQNWALEQGQVRLFAKNKTRSLFIEAYSSFVQEQVAFEDRDYYRVDYQKQKMLDRYGFRWVGKYWWTNLGQLKHLSLAPFYWHSLNAYGANNWELGYEFTWHRAIGDSQLIDDEEVNAGLEHRANLKWAVVDSKDIQFHLLFTFDLDKFGSGETWEGGNGQLRAYF